MKTKGYVVNGTYEMLTVGAEALVTLAKFVASLGENAEVSEFRVYENMAVEAVVATDDGETGLQFTTYQWTRDEWVETGTR